MPNWCDTTYYIEGESSALMYENLKKREASSDCNWNWLGHFVTDFGGDSSKIYSRGWINGYDYNEDDRILTLYCETAWTECNEWRHFIISKCEDLTISFIAEESGNDYYVTNIPDYEFPFVVETDDEHFDLRDASQVLATVCEYSECEVPDCDDEFEMAMRLADEYNEKHKDDDKYVFVNRFTYYD